MKTLLAPLLAPWIAGMSRKHAANAQRDVPLADFFSLSFVPERTAPYDWELSAGLSSGPERAAH